MFKVYSQVFIKNVWCTDNISALFKNLICFSKLLCFFKSIGKVKSNGLVSAKEGNTSIIIEKEGRIHNKKWMCEYPNSTFSHFTPESAQNPSDYNFLVSPFQEVTCDWEVFTTRPLYLSIVLHSFISQTSTGYFYPIV